MLNVFHRPNNSNLSSPTPATNIGDQFKTPTSPKSNTKQKYTKNTKQCNCVCKTGNQLNSNENVSNNGSRTLQRNNDSNITTKSSIKYSMYNFGRSRQSFPESGNK